MAKLLYTASAGGAFRTCPRLYQLKTLRGVRAVRPRRARAFGTIIHAGVESYWSTRQAGDPVGALDAARRTAASWLLDVPLFDPFDYAKTNVMLALYAAVWDTVPCEVLAVEAEFRAPLYRPDYGPASKTACDRFERAGKIDLIVRLADGRVMLVEHKTSSDDVGPGTDYNRRLTLDEQVSFYYGGAIALGFKPDGVIYDVLRKFQDKPHLATPREKRVIVHDRKTKLPRLKSGQRERDETPEEFEARLLKRAMAEPDRYVVRSELTRTVPERRAAALAVWKQTRLMLHAIDNDLFYPNSAACLQYGGCEFADHCLEGASLDDPARYRKGGAHEELAGAGEEASG